MSSKTTISNLLKVGCLAGSLLVGPLLAPPERSSLCIGQIKADVTRAIRSWFSASESVCVRLKILEANVLRDGTTEEKRFLAAFLREFRRVPAAPSIEHTFFGSQTLSLNIEDWEYFGEALAKFIRGVIVDNIQPEALERRKTDARVNLETMVSRPGRGLSVLNLLLSNLLPKLIACIFPTQEQYFKVNMHKLLAYVFGGDVNANQGIYRNLHRMLVERWGQQAGR